MDLVRAHPGMGLAPVLFVLAVHPGGCNEFRIDWRRDTELPDGQRPIGIEDVLDNARVLDLRIWRPGQYLQALPPYGAI